MSKLSIREVACGCLLLANPLLAQNQPQMLANIANGFRGSDPLAYVGLPVAAPRATVGGFFFPPASRHRMHIRHYLATLEYVNRERARTDLAPLDRLPVGQPGDPHDCVIARALPGATVTNELAIPGQAPRRLPAAVARFVGEFDSEGSLRGGDPAVLVDGGIDDDKGCLVPA